MSLISEYQSYDAFSDGEKKKLITGKFDLEKGILDDEYNNITFQDCTVTNGSFTCSNFINCKFVNMTFLLMYLDYVTFIQCSFNNCTIECCTVDYLGFEDCKQINNLKFK